MVNFNSYSAISKNNMKESQILLFVASTLIFVLIIISCIFPEDIDSNLKRYSNIMPFLGVTLSILAIVVALLSFKNSILRPRLKLQVDPLQQISSQAILSVDSNNRVSGGRPLNEWPLTLVNKGKASARYPMVQMTFELASHEGRYFKKNDFPGWKAISQAHGRGYYQFQWNGDNSVILYPGFPVSLPTLHFLGKSFESDFVVVFDFIADGIPRTTLRISVQIHRLKCPLPEGKGLCPEEK